MTTAAGRVRPHLPALAGAALGVAVLSWLGLLGFAWTDYDTEASGAFKALAEGHVGRFLELCPAYGGSMVLRAPFALIPGAWGGGELAVFRAVSLPCMIAAALLGVVVAGRARTLGVGPLARLSALGLLAVGPLSLRALDIGHPEELLVAALVVGAALLALDGRPLWAAVALGVAIGCKPWALVAAGPVLAALPRHHLRAALAAVLCAGALVAPIAVGATSTFRTTTAGMTSTGAMFQPWEAWWWLGDHGHVVRGLDGHVKPGYRAAPAWINRVTHPAIILAAAALSAAWWLRRRRARPGDELLLLALALHLRCVLDAWNTAYYAIPCVFALVAWETLYARRPPALALGVTAAGWASFVYLPGFLSADALSLAYLAWALPLALVLAGRLFAPQRQASRDRLGDLVPAAARAM